MAGGKPCETVDMITDKGEPTRANWDQVKELQEAGWKLKGEVKTKPKPKGE